jgi:hypothetical protein
MQVHKIFYNASWHLWEEQQWSYQAMTLKCDVALYCRNLVHIVNMDDAEHSPSHFQEANIQQQMLIWCLESVVSGVLIFWSR